MKKLQVDILILTSKKMEKSLSRHLRNKWKKGINSDGRRKRGGAGLKKLFDRNKWFQYKNNSFHLNGEKFTDRKVNHLGIISIVSNVDLENFLDAYYCNFDYLFITPELGWNKEMSEFEGYDIAENLINTIYKNRILQIKFMSILSQDLLCNNVPENKLAFAESFQHLSFLDLPDSDELFNQYSDIHFELIKNLSMTLKGRLAGKEHLFGSVYNNITSGASEPLSKLKENLIDVLQKFKSIEALLDIDINKLTKQINSTDQYGKLLDVAELIRSSFVSAEIKNEESDNKSVKKFNYSVCIIEDNAKYLSLLSKTFGSIFRNIYPNDEQLNSYDINKLRNSIEEIADDFDVFILDLLFQEGEAWLPYNGLELYDKIQRENPYAVIRIVTNLPREIISRISRKMMIEGKISEEISLSSIFTKSRGDKMLVSSILDRSDELVSECKNNEKKKNEGEYTIPKLGPFRKPGVKKYVQYLLKNNPDRFSSILDQAYYHFELFKNGDLQEDTPGWNTGELPGPNRFNNNWHNSDLEGHLPNILTHRLMILSMMDSDSNILDLNKYERRVSELVGFKSFHETHYLTTRLGLGKSVIDTGDIEKYSVNHEEILHVRIHLDNLFVHENEYLRNEVMSISQKHVRDVNEKLFEWLKDFLVSDNGFMGFMHINRKEPDFNIPYAESAYEKNKPEWGDIKDELLTIDYVIQLVRLMNKYKENKNLKESIEDSESSYDKIYSPDNSLDNVPEEILQELEELYVSVY